MEPITLIITALTEGLAAAAKEVVSDEIKAGYKKLKEMILRKFGGKGDIADALEKVENKPDSNGRRETLAEELTESGAAKDSELLEQARIFLELVKQAGTSYSAEAHDNRDNSTVVQGENNVTATHGSVAVGGNILGPVTINNQRTSPESDWETGYLNTLIAHCDPLDLSQIDETHSQSSDAANAIKISDVFTTLYLEGVTRYPDQSIAQALAPQKDSEIPGAKEEEPLPIQALEAVAALPRLVILGKPGGGKTTLVNHLAAQLAYRYFKNKEKIKELPGWTDETPTLPVCIILRRFAAWLSADVSQGNCGQVWNYLEYQFGEWGCKEAYQPLKQKLFKEGGVIIFDGLDEVRQTDAETKRTVIKEAIAQFSVALTECKIIVTCREYAYQKGDAWRLPESEFPEVRLALFAPEQIEAFTRTWYRTVVAPPKKWGANKYQTEAEHLNAAIKRLPHLRQLAPYPLLLTLMALVHCRDGNLPENRADLYEKATNLLLSYWENRIVRDTEFEPGLLIQLEVHAEKLRAALERVAFEAHERQETDQSRGGQCADIPKGELRELLAADLKSWDKAETALTYIQTRAGLLQAEDHRTYRFPHRTFQEYLTATHILRQSEFDTMLRNRVRRDLNWWKEVFLLAAGASRDTPRNISDLVDTLLPEKPQAKTITSEQAAQARLAAQAMHETNFTDHVRKEKRGEPGRYTRTFECVRSWLLSAMVADESLSPKDRAASGDALNWLGDPRFREDSLYLPDEPLLGFVEIPAGPFRMGEDHIAVTIPIFYISRYPVTVVQFQAFVDAGGYAEARYWPEAKAVGVWFEGALKGRYDRKKQSYLERLGEPFELANHPVVRVTWYESLAYCRWLTEQLQKREHTPEPLASLLREDNWKVLLPGEAQWEKAARGCDGLIYPWGDKFDAERANCEASRIGSICAVGGFPSGASPFGLMDMSGNVWEWCATKWRDNYNDTLEDNNPKAKDLRVLRGGSFGSVERILRCSYRGRIIPDFRRADVGFRVVVAPGSFAEL